ncbi:MAG: CRISPR system precrRNA processing endoribonuclease RAMP protein Cas6 [Anaerolineales bacterium]|nr:CRISPR system precrRNA processing endoribonuclease RAMP protein Cas6 [Anaerolineales bacterium]
MRLYSSVIKLTNQYPATLTHLGGQHAHAAFLDIVRAVDESLSQRLHDLNGRKPFTVSPLMGLPKGFNREARKEREEDRMKNSIAKSEIRLREGWECWLRVTMLDDGLFKSFIDYFMNLTSPPSPLLKGEGSQKGEGSLPRIRLGDAHFMVSEILTTPGSHPWAGYISIEELQKRLDEPAPEKFTFELFTPTSFRLQDKEVATLPTPKLVFGNLAGAWRALTGENNVEAVEKYAEKNLTLGTYKLRTDRLILHSNPQLGSVGRLEFIRTDKTDHFPARALNLLADFAFYSGLGRKTTHGMGMVRRVVQ